MNAIEYMLPLCTFAGTLMVLVVGFIYNNSRISDLRSNLNHRLDSINQRFMDFRDLVDAKFARQEEMFLAKFAELDNRLTRIESHLNLR